MATELTWHNMLAEEKQQPYFVNTPRTATDERQSGMTIYPPQKDAFNAFRSTELNGVRIVILDQNPYHGPGQAHGLAFSVHSDIITPSSSLNMYRELEATIPGFTRPARGCLGSWACQGILLLNTVLTVHAGQAHSRASLGWEISTDKVTSLINQRRRGVVFLLWGSHAQKKGAIIDTQYHHALKVSRPPPLSAHRGFFDCSHFMLANERLE